MGFSNSLWLLLCGEGAGGEGWGGAGQPGDWEDTVTGPRKEGTVVWPAVKAVETEKRRWALRGVPKKWLDFPNN